MFFRVGFHRKQNLPAKSVKESRYSALQSVVTKNNDRMFWL
jgi:hypothetical protein